MNLVERYIAVSQMPALKRKPSGKSRVERREASAPIARRAPRLASPARPTLRLSALRSPRLIGEVYEGSCKTRARTRPENVFVCSAVRAQGECRRSSDVFLVQKRRCEASAMGNEGEGASP
jgi:hypothetical protein